MPAGYEHNAATVGALHPPNSYDARQGARSKAWFLGFQNYAKMHSIVPPASRPPVSVQAMEAMLNPDALGHSKNDLFAAVSGHSLIPTNRPGIYGGILSAHLANSGLAHLNGDGILANPLAVQESTQLHQQVSRGKGRQDSNAEKYWQSPNFKVVRIWRTGMGKAEEES